MKIEDKFDLFVIGGGSGGVRAARFGASQGLKVGLAEDGTNLCKQRLWCLKLFIFISFF